MPDWIGQLGEELGVQSRQAALDVFLHSVLQAVLIQKGGFALAPGAVEWLKKGLAAPDVSFQACLSSTPSFDASNGGHGLFLVDMFNALRRKVGAAIAWRNWFHAFLFLGAALVYIGSTGYHAIHIYGIGVSAMLLQRSLCWRCCRLCAQRGGRYAGPGLAFSCRAREGVQDGAAWVQSSRWKPHGVASGSGVSLSRL